MLTLPRDADAHAYLRTQGIRITAAERRLGVETTSLVYKVRHFVCRQLFCLCSNLPALAVDIGLQLAQSQTHTERARESDRDLQCRRVLTHERTRVVTRPHTHTQTRRKLWNTLSTMRQSVSKLLRATI
jgi:hypothetical protein